MAYLSILIWLINARKRSLRQGNVFTRVCHSVQGGVHAMHTPLPCMPSPPCTPTCHTRPLPRMPSPTTHAPPRDMVNERAVRILLECILILNYSCPKMLKKTPKHTD